MSEVWSDELRTLTREVIEEGRLGFAPDGKQIHLKHVSGAFGTLSTNDLAFGAEFRIICKETEKVTIFDTVNDLLYAGWAVD